MILAVMLMIWHGHNTHLMEYSINYDSNTSCFMHHSMSPFEIEWIQSYNYLVSLPYPKITNNIKNECERTNNLYLCLLAIFCSPTADSGEKPTLIRICRWIRVLRVWGKAFFTLFFQFKLNWLHSIFYFCW